MLRRHTTGIAAALTRTFLIISFLMMVRGRARAEGPVGDARLQWPEINRECRPGTYWWWMGSAVDRANLTRELERYRAAGLGGVHIVPIYGAKGYESRYIEYLSPRWMAMLDHTVREARRLDMFVDMTTGTGWCFGGPNVPLEEACALVDVKTLRYQPSRQLVKRAAPGGEGLMLNPLYGKAIRHYLERFTAAFAAHDGLRLRAMYHDSYEYSTNWSPDLLAEFAKRRGYRLEKEIRALRGKDTNDHAARVKSDYRETLSDMLIENYIPVWIKWCRDHGFQTRYQAHGSPANILDLYAASDIPETEMYDRDRSILVSKLASSAAHVAGRRLVASETGTWLKEHFTETLADMKDLVDQLFLSGVNHVVYHGTCYSPDDAVWPGWLFYASTQMNPRNSIWRDVPALNAYVARCQSVLQAGRPDNDILLYWPIYDLWHHTSGMAEQISVHGRSWLESQPRGELLQRLWDRGYGFDFVSDRQLAAARTTDGRIVVPGGSYQTVLVPPCEHLPLATLSALLSLAESGASIVFAESLPKDVPGTGGLVGRRAQLQQMIERLRFRPSGDGRLRTAALGKGRVVVGPVEAALGAVGVRRETLADQPGLHLIRRALDDGHYYFIDNRSQRPVDDWVQLGVGAKSVAILDPMTGQIGMAALRRANQVQTHVRLQLEPGESLILRTFTDGAVAGDVWPYRGRVTEQIEIAGTWQVKFIEGGPDLPRPLETTKLISWTKPGGEAAERFAGTARYTLVFDAPAQSASNWAIDLGDVRHSARVRVNGESLGTIFVPPFRVPLRQLKPKGNVLEIEVTNLSANRIRDLDRRGVQWRNFRDINFIGIGKRAFDASKWPLQDSGLLGPVRLLGYRAIVEPL